MPRPSQNIDRLLIKTGLQLMRETGAADLKVRQVAARAKVNLGMFHYHFKSRDEFTRCLLQQVYEEFFKGFVLETSRNDVPLERLRRALVALGKFARDQRPLLMALLRDGMRGHRQSIEFAKKNIPRHLRILRELIMECQRKRLIRKVPIPFAITFLMGSIGMPSVIVAMLERCRAATRLPIALVDFKASVLSDSAVEARVEMALKGISGGA